MLSVCKQPLSFLFLFVIIQIESRRTELVFFSECGPQANCSRITGELVKRQVLSLSLRQIARYLCDMGPRSGHFKMLLKDSHVHKSSKHCLKSLVAPDGGTSELLGNEVQNHSLRSN